MTHSLARLIQSDGLIPDGGGDVRITGLTSDSRKVENGFLFAALPGTNTDGQKFLADAASRGAVAAIVGEGALDVAGLTLVRCVNPRRLLALAAARFFDDQPDTIVAVTGTNGKTSVAVFVRQIWAEMGFRAASLGTIGIVGPEGVTSLSHTTPDPVALQKAVADLAKSGVEHLAIEASSHGLFRTGLMDS
jgi:UDP-N-acetylmuramoyl-L-alanyl-D-glutamate--2,6-diaminopimelate ligase